MSTLRWLFCCSIELTRRLKVSRGLSGRHEIDIFCILLYALRREMGRSFKKPQKSEWRESEMLWTHKNSIDLNVSKPQQCRIHEMILQLLAWFFPSTIWIRQFIFCLQESFAALRDFQYPHSLCSHHHLFRIERDFNKFPLHCNFSPQSLFCLLFPIPYALLSPRVLSRHRGEREKTIEWTCRRSFYWLATSDEDLQTFFFALSTFRLGDEFVAGSIELSETTVRQ